MKRGFLFSPPVLRIGLACFGLAALLATQLIAQLSRNIKAKDVKFPDFYDSLGPGQTNRLKGLLTGREGQYLSNEVVLISHMQLEYYQPDGRTGFVARAPQCLFDQDARIAWSTSRLDIVGLEGALLVKGQQGFEVRMTNSSMILSNRVRTLIRQAMMPSASSSSSRP